VGHTLKGLFRDELTPTRTWVLLNKMLPDFVRSFSDFLEVARYLSPIPWDADVVRAYARRKIALNLEVGNEYTLAVMRTLKMLLGEEVSEEITAWANQRAAVFRQPIENQYRVTEQELEGLLYERKRLELKSARSRVFRRAAALAIITAILIGSLQLFEYLLGNIRGILDPLISTDALEILLMVAATVAAVLVYTMSISRVTSTDYAEEARIRRRETLLEEKLRKLEALREADLETLVKGSHSQVDSQAAP
jgi:hypothetical protein